MDGLTDQYGQALGSMTKEQFNQLLQENPELARQIQGGLFEDYRGGEKMIGEQLNMADELRNTPTPEGRQTGGKYGVYVAANPLEHVGASAQRMIGDHRRKGTMGDWRSLQAKQADALRGLSGLGASGKINPLEYMP